MWTDSLRELPNGAVVYGEHTITQGPDIGTTVLLCYWDQEWVTWQTNVLDRDDTFWGRYFNNPRMAFLSFIERICELERWNIDRVMESLKERQKT